MIEFHPPVLVFRVGPLVYRSVLKSEIRNQACLSTSESHLSCVSCGQFAQKEWQLYASQIIEFHCPGSAQLCPKINLAIFQFTELFVKLPVTVKNVTVSKILLRRLQLKVRSTSS